MQVQSLGQENPLEKEMATYASILAWKIPSDLVCMHEELSKFSKETVYKINI